MSEEIVPVSSSPAVIPATAPIVRKEDGNIAVTALVPEQMSSCQNALIAWCQDKVETIKAEATELKAAYEYAKARKWRTVTLKKHADLSADRVVFYEKMLSALQHGYVIVPNFPISLFAIRREEGSKAEGKWTDVRAGYYVPKYQQEPHLLPAGEGEYKNPFPHVCSSFPEKREGDPYEHTWTWPGEWKEMNFPITMAKPQIMEAADRTMALKIFDQLGILPAETAIAKRAKGDPIIVGQLHDPRGRIVTFLIAWHLDTRVL